MNITTESTQTMTDQLNLIKGEFSPTDAYDILENLISKKINYHIARNFSSEIRFGKKDHYSIQRISELKEMQNFFNELIEDAKQQGKKISIHSDILIKLV